MARTSNHEYLITPFNNAHKILYFTFTDQQDRGRNYWKLNPSILDDKAYIDLVRQTITHVDTLNTLENQKWWDISLTTIRLKTVDYTKQKYFIENSIREKIKQDLLTLEAIPSERLTPSKASHYNFLKERYRIFQEKLIDGYRQRTRGHPKYEQREPDIELYAKLEKRSSKRTLIGELRPNGEVYSDNKNLMNIVTDVYRLL